MAEVFLCETGQLTAASRRELRRAGIVVVEVDDPSRCQFIRAGESVSHSDMLWAAVDALKASTSSSSSDQAHQNRFARNIFTLIEQAYARDRERAAHDGNQA